MRLLKTLVREPKTYLVRWYKNFYIQYKYPDAAISFPIIWNYDTLDVIELGAGSYIGPFSEIVVSQKSPYTKVSGRLIVEERAVIGASANIRAAGGEIFIGRNAMLAHNVSIVASNHTISVEAPYRDLPWDETKTGVVIEENVWIGAGVTVLPGCVVGKNSVIGAGSVITKSVPANEIWAGIPASKLKSIG